MQAPLLRLLVDVGGEVPSRQAHPERGDDADSRELLRQMRETMVGSGFPQPIGGRLGIIAEALLALSKRILGLLRPVMSVTAPTNSTLPDASFTARATAWTCFTDPSGISSRYS